MWCDLLIKDSAGRSMRAKIRLFEEKTKNITVVLSVGAVIRNTIPRRQYC